MNRVVLDTDVWSFLFKRDSRAEKYRTHLEGNILFVSFQTVAELYQWMEFARWGPRRRSELRDWLRNFGVLGYDDATAHFGLVSAPSGIGKGVLWPLRMPGLRPVLCAITIRL